MKIVLTTIAVFVILVITYFLYQHSLGAIPFLIASFVFFYLGRKKLNSDGEENNEK